MRARIESVKFALKGWYHAYQELNFKIHIVIGLLTTMTGVYYEINRIEWCIILLLYAGVLSTEAINTAIEKLSDKVCPDNNEVIRIVKDIAAGAVLMWAVIAVIVGLMIFAPYLIRP